MPQPRPPPSLRLLALAPPVDVRPVIPCDPPFVVCQFGSLYSRTACNALSNCGGLEIDNQPAVIGQVEPALAVKPIAATVAERLFTNRAAPNDRCGCGFEWSSRENSISARRGELRLRLRIGEGEAIAETPHPAGGAAPKPRVAISKQCPAVGERE